jgi:hypothetical protein
MKKRVLVLATVAALMGVMLVAMASVALAAPPATGNPSCAGGKLNAEHALFDSAAPYTDNGNNPNGLEQRNQNPPGRETADANLSDTSNCHN